MTKCLILQLLTIAHTVSGLGKMLPTEYLEGERIPIFVSQISSAKVNIPYSYFDVGTCRPAEHGKNPYISKNWGEALTGEKWAYSPYELTLRTEQTSGYDPSQFQCKVACSQPYDPAVRNRYNMMSHNKYFYNLMLDDLPSATVISPKGT